MHPNTSRPFPQTCVRMQVSRKSIHSYGNPYHLQQVCKIPLLVFFTSGICLEYSETFDFFSYFGEICGRKLDKQSSLKVKLNNTFWTHSSENPMKRINKRIKWWKAEYHAQWFINLSITPFENQTTHSSTDLLAFPFVLLLLPFYIIDNGESSSDIKQNHRFNTQVSANEVLMLQH